jgi:hypothetical protein
MMSVSSGAVPLSTLTDWPNPKFDTRNFKPVAAAWAGVPRIGLGLAALPGMTSRQFAGFIGAAYLFLGSLGALVYVFPGGLLHQTLHVGVGVWGMTAASGAGTAVGFARKAAVLLGVFVLLEVTAPLREYFGGFMLEGRSLLMLHALTAMAAAYYGYYWTDAVVEAAPDRSERRKAA